MKIVAFSKYIGFNAGGAELSMQAILEQKSKEGHSCHIVSLTESNFGSGIKFNKWDIPENYSITWLSGFIRLRRFAFTEFLLNFFKLYFYFRKQDPNQTLYTYGLWAPIAALGFTGPCRIYLRAESDLGIIRNHDSGLKWIAKEIYQILEFPGRVIYKLALGLASNKSTIIANSKFIATRFRDIYCREATVEYPSIEIKRLHEAFAIKSREIPDVKKGVVFVGDSQIKGLNIVLDIAKSSKSDLIFYIFGRFATTPPPDKNICWHNWCDDSSDIYKYAKVVIVPSICEEAYGRVAREAFLLDIPTLVSKRGGLPEAVNEKPEYIVEDYLNPKTWLARIESAVITEK